jgi:diguanylate cyclase
MPVARGTLLLLAHVATQALCLAGLWLMPAGGWLHAIWQSLAGISAGAFFLAGLRLHAPRPRLPWYLIGAGLIISSAGTTVEMIAWRCCDVTTNPNVADGFWLTLHGGLVVGLAIFVYRQAACEELGTGTLNTIASALLNLFVGVLSWQYIVWRAHSDHTLTLANRFIVTLYPLADLMVIALLLRLLLGGGFRNASLLLVTTSMGWFMASDLGWSDFIRTHAFPDRWLQFVVEATSVGARATLGATTLLPAVRTLGPSDEHPLPRLGWLGWLGLVASTLTAPVVLALQALLDRLYSVTSF